MKSRMYAAIDLKSFYASVECVERGLDPLTTNLVVADSSRTEKTICLAVSPSLKAHGVPSRPRLFEVISKVREVNSSRVWSAPGHKFDSSTYNDILLRSDPSLALDYIVAPPRMASYIEYSTKIYGIYLKYFAPEDIHVYSIDEVFIDLSNYRLIYKKTPKEIIKTVLDDVLAQTGITATAGIGTNLYLAKVAMDIVAKHIRADKNGAKIAEIDEYKYRKLLWDHRPITDFWRVGQGYKKRLESVGMYTMGDVALMSLKNEALLYKLFGINAELLIDHAWGWEPCTISDIKSYRPLTSSLSSGQVLSCSYEASKAKTVCREMTEQLALDMVDRGVVTNQIVITLGYDAENVRNGYSGEVKLDFYGRAVPKHAHGSASLAYYTSSGSEITAAAMDLFDRIVDPKLLIKKLTVCANNLMSEDMRVSLDSSSQLRFFDDGAEEREKNYTKEHKAQKALISIKKKHGKNAILKGVSFEEGATGIERNLQIGGHKA